MTFDRHSTKTLDGSQNIMQNQKKKKNRFKWIFEHVKFTRKKKKCDQKVELHFNDI